MNSREKAIELIGEAKRCFTVEGQQSRVRAAQVYALLAIADAIRDNGQTPAFGGTCPGSNQ